MALITDESGNAEYPRTYTAKVFDKNGNAINDRVVYGEPDGSITVESMSPILHQSDVVDTLTSDSTTTPLSAAKGKDLQGQVTTLNSTLDKMYTPGNLPSTITDFNNLTTPKRYALLGQTNINNAPVGGIYGYIDVVNYGGFIGQVIYSFQSVYMTMYVRRYNNTYNTWSNWRGINSTTL